MDAAVELRTAIGHGVDVRGLELGKLAEFQNKLGQLVRVGELGQDVGIGGKTGLGLALDREAELHEEDLAQLFGRVDIELFFGGLVDLFGELPDLLFHLFGEGPEQGLVDGDAGHLHVANDLDERQLHLVE